MYYVYTYVMRTTVERGKQEPRYSIPPSSPHTLVGPRPSHTQPTGRYQLSGHAEKLTVSCIPKLWTGLNLTVDFCDFLLKLLPL